MSFLKEIEQKKTALKKMELLRKDGAKLEKMIVEDESDYHRLMKETYFEKYYNLIEKFTFKSVVMSLSLEDIRSMYEANKQFRENGSTEFDLSNIEAKVEEGISLVRELAQSECQVFVRLSSRSPKDAIYHLANFTDLYQEKLDEMNDQEDLFSKLHAFYKASTEVMAISSGAAASELLRKSDRIVGDLEVCLEKSEPINLIIREFVKFPVKNELRGFVYGGVLTALTQYNNLAYFPEQKDKKAGVEAKVRSFMEDFIQAMDSHLDSFVVDIVVDDEGKVWVVEVNPFGELAGSCLFSWSKDRDVLMGKGDFEFRIVEAPPSLGYIKTEIDTRVLDMLAIK